MAFMLNPVFWYLVITLVFGYLCSRKAEDIGMDRVLGLGVGIWLGPIGYLILWFISKKKRPD